MNMIIPFEARKKNVEEIFRSVGPRESFFIALFTDPVAAQPGDDLEDYVLANFVGAAPIAIARNAWGAPVLLAGVAQLPLVPAPSWTMTGGQVETVYGWVLYGALTDLVYAAQTFDNPHTFTVGATLTLDPFKIDSTQI